jgi:uncharacterized protein
MSLSTPASPLDPEARPIDASDRIVLLDVLRGFALAGVFVSNVFIWFTGRVFLPRAQAQAALESAPWWDTVAVQFYGTLVSGKFITLFSLLFGLGFSVQLMRAEARGASGVPLYVRRLCVMLLMGGVHLTALWYGDILTLYATLGFLLLPFRKRSDRTLWVWALVFILVMPPLIAAAQRWLPPLLGASAPDMSEAARASAEAARVERGRIFQSGTYAEIVRNNVGYFFGEFIQRLPPLLLALLGRFLLGLLAGRRRLFHDASAHQPLFRKLLGWGLAVGGVCSVAGMVVQYLVRKKLMEGNGPGQLMMLPVRQLGDLGMATFYASGLVLLFQRERWARALRVLAPVGRMALTNYLSQTVMSLFVYYGIGLGLMGQVPPAASIGLTLALFTLQVAWSHWWLARFRFGPAEWVWRSLTYGKRQPLRLEAPTPVPAP